MFSAHNEQNNMQRGEMWFPKNYEKNFDLENFLSESFLIRTSSKGRAPASELVLLKGGPCLPRSHYKGNPQVQN